MHLLLTDQLTCPKCGPEFGVVLLAERVEGRRVYEGKLGCPNCRREYPVRGGVVDMVVGVGSAAVDAATDADRLAALLGVAEGPAMLLLLGVYENVAEQMASMLDNVEIIVAHNAMQPAAERMGVSRLRIGDVVPLHDRGMRGVALADGAALPLVREAARVCGLACRLVLSGVSAEARELLQQLRMHVVAEQGETLIAVRHA